MEKYARKQRLRKAETSSFHGTKEEKEKTFL